jgi:hypothetical protein
MVTANVSNLLFLFTLMMEAIGSFDTSVLTTFTRRHSIEDVIFHEELCLLGCYAVWLL